MIWFLLKKHGWDYISLALLVISIEIILTGGLHFDGLMDTADGIAAGDKNCSEAMKDSRVGAIGIQSLIIILFIQVASLARLGLVAPLALPIANFWGRCSPLWAINSFPYLNSKGNSSFHREAWKGSQELIPSLISILAFISVLKHINIYAFTPLNIYIFTFIGIIPAVLVPHLIGKHLKGHNGDSYGASTVITTSITLLIFALMFPLN